MTDVDPLPPAPPERESQFVPAFLGYTVVFFVIATVADALWDWFAGEPIAFGGAALRNALAALLFGLAMAWLFHRGTAK